jgi:hypothetical protein
VAAPGWATESIPRAPGSPASAILIGTTTRRSTSSAAPGASAITVTVRGGSAVAVRDGSAVGSQ